MGRAVEAGPPPSDQVEKRPPARLADPVAVTLHHAPPLVQNLHEDLPVRRVDLPYPPLRRSRGVSCGGRHTFPPAPGRWRPPLELNFKLTQKSQLVKEATKASKSALAACRTAQKTNQDSGIFHFLTKKTETPALRPGSAPSRGLPSRAGRGQGPSRDDRPPGTAVSKEGGRSPPA